MVPPAPPRLSIVNGWPVDSATLCIPVRPAISLPPPGAQRITTRTGFAGYAAGLAARAVANRNPAARGNKLHNEYLIFSPVLRYCSGVMPAALTVFAHF